MCNILSNVTLSPTTVQIVYATFSSFDRLLPRLFIDASVLGNVAIATASGKLAASCAPEIALVTIYWTSELGGSGSGGGGGSSCWHSLVVAAAAATPHQLQSSHHSCIQSINFHQSSRTIFQTDTTVNPC